MHKLINIRKEKTIWNYSSHGPTFGGDKSGGPADLFICDRSNSCNTSHAAIGNSYCDDSHYPKGQSSSW